MHADLTRPPRQSALSRRPYVADLARMLAPSMRKRVRTGDPAWSPCPNADALQFMQARSYSNRGQTRGLPLHIRLSKSVCYGDFVGVARRGHPLRPRDAA